MTTLSVMAVHILIPDPSASHNWTDVLSSTPSANASNMSTSSDVSQTFTIPTLEPNSTEPLPPCLWILYAEIGKSNIRVWDLMLLVPNAIFLLFLLLRSKVAVAKLRQTNRPIFFTFYIMAFVATIVSVIRAIVSMIVDATTLPGDLTDTILWLAVRFALLSIELSVVIFGIGFSHLDSRSSITLILLITCVISFCYSVVQGCLEVIYPDEHYEDPKEHDIFTHGGMIFWCVTSSIFCLAYITVFLLPYTPVKNRIQLPAKRSFYCYIASLALLNFSQAIGSGLVYDDVQPAICLVDITSFLYFTCFAPLIYITFLHNFFLASKQLLLLSYASQPDENDDEAHHLPYSVSRDDTFNQSLYDSTEFGQGSPPAISGQLSFSINAQIEPVPHDLGDTKG
ncbi:transmembrane protein adipocyte-associated 1 homolog [Lytechinus variegatus]|uniref:transmembrane protein adipocyte-associated 1 homolog n=1 Tax=Lytechinus variegatus TaxID=7654 RepID=UPI001BB1EC2B|nr:transmembrane protein adipocyte-associated 1 homolog [Lytechinus variegatus]